MSDAEPADGPAAARWPNVDVVMPVRNEAEHLAAAVAAVRAQDYPGRLTIVLGVAPSVDDTEELAARIGAAVSDVEVVANPAGTTPAGLNAAIRAGSAPVVVRVDGHSRLPAGYVRRAVETLRRSGAANVGGRQVPVATTPFEEAVAAATSSWLGTGGTSYRVGGEEGPVDTVYLGVFDRGAIEAVGLFDEQLIRNQDYELNIRLRDAGGDVWFDPELWVGYTPRGSWRALGTQYYEYGYWKAVVLRMHPRSLKLRQLVPPLAVAGVGAGLLLGVRQPRLLVVPAAYAAAVAAAMRHTARRSGAAAFAVPVLIHVAWVGGIVAGTVGGRPRRRLRK